MSCGDNTNWGPRQHELISVQAAWADLATQVSPGPTEPLAIHDGLGRVLAEPVIATDDYPPFDKAMMDGYAVRAAECAAPGAVLRSVGMVAAGAVPDRAVEPGEAMQINTGAPLPPGADAVVMVEKTAAIDVGARVRIETAVKARQNVERHGAVRRRGDHVLSAGTRLTPGAIASAATAGAGTLTVRRIPGVAIVLTGDEIVPADAPLSPGKIHDSNGPILPALLQQLGARPRTPIVAPDEPGALAAHLQTALEEPVVLSVGGMSMGTLDLVPAAFEKLGVTWRWHGVAMRPGRPVAYGRGPGGQHVFGLPGNPVSAFVCTWLFVKPVLDGLQGLPPQPPARRTARLAGDLKPHRDPRPAFMPARTWADADGVTWIEPVAWQGSSDPFGLVGADALLMRLRPAEAAGRGTPIEFLDIG